MALRYPLAHATRRDLFYAGGAFALGTLLSLIAASGTPACAAPLPSVAPQIDQLSIRIIVDNYQMAVAQDATAGNVDVKRYGFALGAFPPSRALLSEFGLSLLATSRRGAESRSTLVDFAYTPQTLLNNLDLLGIDPATIDALVLSHGHFDHYGGLAGFLEQTKGRRKPKLPIYLGGEECFCARQWTAPPVRGDFGALDRRALETADLSIMFSPGPALVAEHGFTTGRIELASFEKVLSPSTMKIGRTGVLGCYPEEFTAEERQKATIPDQFRHEIGTAFHIKGRGLVILTSCSHRGVVNVIEQARRASGVSKIHAIVGGLHLAPQNEGYVRQTVDALRAIDPDYVVPLHCSGEPFYEIMKAEMPTKLLRGYTGTEFTFHS
jgi:7,8-dihydropterin-6-yl-methyl-4-(beta-D-ribofuranosyl)aminobenzene 5'-phosphate synthase